MRNIINQTLSVTTDIDEQHREEQGLQMQSTSRLAPLGLSRGTANSAQEMQVTAHSKNKRKQFSSIGTFNVQGLLSPVKQMMIADDFFRYGLKALMIQETHIQGSGFLDMKSSNGKTVRLYYSGHKTRSIHGVGIMVDINTNCEFQPITSRLMVLTVNDNIKTNLISAYAPTNQKTKKYPDKTSSFYNKLSSIIKKMKEKEAVAIGGDFNAKTKTDKDQRSPSVGNYCKSKIDENGQYLLEFAEMNNLKLTNTFFKHKPAHLSTWQCPQRIQEINDANTGTTRINPYRNQIDYIITRKSNNLKVQDSRSYGGFTCSSDHKPVIAKINLKWKKAIHPKQRKMTINSSGIHESNETIARYQNLIRANIQNMKPKSVQEKWDNLVKCTTNAAIEVAGYKQRSKKSSNITIQNLSLQQKHLLKEQNSTKCPSKKRELKTIRNKILNEIHKHLKKEENNRISQQIEPIENMPDDPNRTYKAVKHLKKMKQKVKLLVKTETGLTANEETQTKLIAKYFKDQFHKNAEPMPAKAPTPMRFPFTGQEAKEAAKRMKNGTQPGIDNVTTEMLKYAPDEVFEEIASILNEIAQTGNAPKELSLGIITPLQKPNKAKGPVCNLRPITLLSVLRKILALCLCKRTNSRVDAEIPIQQAAYRKGRSTTEHVFAIKMVIERTLMAKNEESHLLLLDMSKAFDTMERKSLIQDLEQIVEPDETHLYQKLLEVKLAVRCGSTTSDFFETDTGGPQGSSDSAKNFTLYLAKTLKPDHNTSQEEQPQVEESSHQQEQLPEEQLPQEQPPVERPPVEQPEEQSTGITIELHYADDINKLSTNKDEIDQTLQQYPDKLARRGLLINHDKTEQYVISENGNQNWKKCKILGTCLDTEVEIKKRKTLAIEAAKNLKPIFENKKIWKTTKSRVFDTYVSSVFLYNASTWTMTKTMENQIDSFQRKMIRINVLNIKWPKKISNENLYKATKIVPWSSKIKKQRLNWFGHLTRLHPDVPAKKAIRYAQENYQKKRGRPITSWISVMKNQLEEDLELTWEDAERTAADRATWRGLVKTKYP